jgi:hypothetical protein
MVALVSGASSASAQELTLQLQDGRVTLIARDVTVSAVLEEWARIGQTTFVNGDKVTGSVSLHFEDAPEREVLDALLRSESGYMAAPRESPLAAGSIYDRVLILAASTRTASAPRRPTPMSPGGRSPLAAPPAPMFPSDADENAPMLPGLQGPPGMDGMMGQDAQETFGQPGQEPDVGPPYPTPDGQPLTPLLPGDAPATGPTPTNPVGLPAGVAATPGVIVQPQQPQQPGRTP